MIDTDALAKRLGEAYAKQTTKRNIRWEDMVPSDRSLWRLIARTAQDELQKTPRRFQVVT